MRSDMPEEEYKPFPSVFNSLTSQDLQGEFDPFTSVLWLHDKISDALDLGDEPGGASGASIEPAGSESILAFTTSLHENIHWWQRLGSTSAFIYSLKVPAQVLETAVLLAQVGTTLPKPLIKHISPVHPLDHPGWLVTRKWMDMEAGATFLRDPAYAQEYLTSCPAYAQRFFVSSGHSLLMLYTNALATLSGEFDADFRVLPDPQGWPDLIAHFAQNGLPAFNKGTHHLLPLGLQDILEGQARISEIQLRCRSYEPLTWAQAKVKGLLNGVYGAAFSRFIELSGLPEPEWPFDGSINLFLLLCDIALTPIQGYPLAIDPEGDFIAEVHPGARFLKLCQLVAEEKSLANDLKFVSFDHYVEASARLCAKAGWPTPIEVAQLIVDCGYNTADGELLANQHEQGDYGLSNMALRFLYAHHLDFNETKADIPHFFCWPAAYLALEEGDDPEVHLAFGECYRAYMAPFQASGLDSGVDTVLLEGLSPEQKANLINEYFLNQMVFELARQWVMQRGEFIYTSKWKPHLKPEEKTHVDDLFFRVYGVKPNDIPRK